MKKLCLLLVVAGLLALSLVLPVQAQGVWGACSGSAAESAICADETEATDLVGRVVNTLLVALGIVAVIMIIHSGLKFVTSRGDPAAIKSAKDTLLYAIIGLVVAVSTYAIVNFVLDAFGGEESSASETGSGAGRVIREATERP